MIYHVVSQVIPWWAAFLGLGRGFGTLLVLDCCSTAALLYRACQALVCGANRRELRVLTQLAERT